MRDVKSSARPDSPSPHTARLRMRESRLAAKFRQALVALQSRTTVAAFMPAARSPSRHAASPLADSSETGVAINAAGICRLIERALAIAPPRRSSPLVAGDRIGERPRAGAVALAAGELAGRGDGLKPGQDGVAVALPRNRRRRRSAWSRCRPCHRRPSRPRCRRPGCGGNAGRCRGPAWPPWYGFLRGVSLSRAGSGFERRCPWIACHLSASWCPGKGPVREQTQTNTE